MSAFSALWGAVADRLLPLGTIALAESPPPMLTAPTPRSVPRPGVWLSDPDRQGVPERCRPPYDGCVIDHNDGFCEVHARWAE